MLVVAYRASTRAWKSLDAHSGIITEKCDNLMNLKKCTFIAVLMVPAVSPGKEQGLPKDRIPLYDGPGGKAASAPGNELLKGSDCFEL